MTEAWITDDDLRTARDRFAAGIPGFVMPVAYGAARRDGSELSFGHVNTVGAVRPLPAVVLASVCGYTDTSGAFELSRDRFAEAVGRLAPAEAATHLPHPNLWSWRALLARARPDDVFVAFFLAAAGDPVDARFRVLAVG